MILSSPGAATLLAELAKSPAHFAMRANLLAQRQEVLSVEKATKALEHMQAIKAYIRRVNKEHDIQILYPNEFMTRLSAFNAFEANGAILLTFGESVVPNAIRSAYGEISHHTSIMHGASVREVRAQYIRDLGLVLVSSSPGGERFEATTTYLVTKLPDGTPLSASQIFPTSVSVLSRDEIYALMAQVPASTRKGIKTKKDSY